MRVLFLINSLGAGGAERSTVELARFLRLRGIDVLFASLKRKKVGIERELDIDGFKVFYCGGSNLFGRLSFLVGLIRLHRPDIVHSVLYDANLVARLSQLFSRKVRYVQSLVNTPYSEERRKDKRLPKAKFALVKYLDCATARLFRSYYHAITNEVLAHYRPLFNIKGENASVIYRGRYENRFRYGPQAPLDLERKGLRLINTGRQEFQKGQIILLKALLHLKRTHGITDIYLSILGREGESSEELNTFIQSHHLGDQVSLLGFRDDVESQLMKYDVFVFPSFFEGLGGALIEAFAAGLPCICSDIAVLREVVGSPDGALFFPPGDYIQLSERIHELYKCPGKQAVLSAYSLRRFNESYRIESISEEMLAMYQKVLKSGNSGV